MRVAVVSPYDLAAPGGVQSQAHDLVDQLNRRGLVAWLVGPGDAEGARSVGQARRIPANGARAPISVNLAVGTRVREACEDADLVHVHEPLMPTVSWAALRLGKPTVATFHAAPTTWVRTSYRWLAAPIRAMLGPAVVTAVSPAAADPIRRTIPDVVIVPNGVDVSSFRRGTWPRDPHLVSFLGRDDPRKGLDVLLSAWPQVQAAVPDARLQVLGASRHERPGVEFVGPVDDVEKKDRLARSGVYCAPNRGGESFGVVLVEAMAAGCAIVASSLDAFRAVAGDAAQYVPVDNPAALAEALIAVLMEDRRRNQLIAAGTRRVGTYDWDRISGRYVELYERAVAAV